MKHWSHLNTAVQILQAYTGQEPFAGYLRKFFSANKKYGSSDRRQIGHLCYCYFRLGKSLANLSLEERVLTGLFFCSTKSHEILQQAKPAWNDVVEKSIEEKWVIAGNGFSIQELFPWKDELSPDIDFETFCNSFFIQPDLFLRIRPGKEKAVKTKLGNAGIVFQQTGPGCLSLANSSKIDQVIELNKEAVVQDYNSQAAGDFLLNVKPDPGLSPGSNLKVWDCCAASGGKSIMAKDILGDIDLIVSDIRESILANLRKRFNDAGIKKYQSFAADLTKQAANLPSLAFDLVIADVPCTGSGTWSRTPEQLFYFEKEKIGEYATKQKAIISNVIPSIKEGGSLLYITCSVFEKENEGMVNFIQQQYKLELTRVEILKGYDKKADTLFAALLQKS
jgi:16S rRNA (cytosine967-C5)-methyltransferase